MQYLADDCTLYDSDVKVCQTFIGWWIRPFIDIVSIAEHKLKTADWLVITAREINKTNKKKKLFRSFRINESYNTKV